MSEPSRAQVTRQILSVVFFNFVGYLTIGIPLAVIPTYVHNMGYGPVLAGIAISVQYVATFLSRAPVGRLSDVNGPKQTMLIGLVACGASGVLTLAAALVSANWVALLLLFLGRLLLGCGESFVTTSSIVWGIGRVGERHTARVISWNGVATYTAIAVGAPLGVLLQEHFGFIAIGVSVLALGWLSIPLALVQPPSAPIPGKPIPLHQVFGKIFPYGLGLALGSIGFGSIATFITLYFATRQWPHAALSLTSFGFFFVAMRLVFAGAIDRVGGYRIAIICFFLEGIGLFLLWSSSSMVMALVGATLTGVGFSLVFPALAVEAVKRVRSDNRGAALAMYSVWVDVALCLTGPLGGVMATHFGFGSIFLSAAIGAWIGVFLIGGVYLWIQRVGVAAART